VINFVRNKAFQNKNIIDIFLVGSLARRDYTAFSDVDLVIIVKEDNRRFID